MGRREDLAIVIRAANNHLATDLAQGSSMLRKWAKDVDTESPKRNPADDLDKGFRKAARSASEAKSSFRSAAVEAASFGFKVAATAGTILALEAGVSSLVDIFAQLKSAVSMAAEL